MPNSIKSEFHYCAARVIFSAEPWSDYGDDGYETALFDHNGVKIDTSSHIDVLYRFANAEGALLALVAQNNVGIGTDIECEEDFEDLTQNQVTLLNFICNIAHSLRNYGYYDFNQNVIFDFICDIITIGDNVFRGTKYHGLLVATFIQRLNKAQALVFSERLNYTPSNFSELY